MSEVTDLKRYRVRLAGKKPDFKNNSHLMFPCFSNNKCKTEDHEIELLFFFYFKREEKSISRIKSMCPNELILFSSWSDLRILS